MPGLGSFALAGAVGGIGESMIEEARQKREDKLAALKRQQELEDQETQHNNRMEQIAATKRRSGGRGGRRGGRGSATTGPTSDGPGNRRKDITSSLEKRLRELFGEDADDDIMGAVFEQAELWKGSGRTENDIFDILRNSANRGDLEETVDTWMPFDEHTVIRPGEGDYDGTFTYGNRQPNPGRGLGPVQNGAPDAAEAPAPAQSRAPQAVPPEAEQALSDARDAIARGADRNAVIARLKEMGIDPEGL